MILLLWSLILFSIIFSEIFENKESYLLLLSFWYLIVFIYYYIKHIIILKNKINMLKLPESNIIDSILKLLYLFLIFIILIVILDDYSFYRMIDDNKIILFLFIYFTFILFSGIIYELFDMVKIFLFKKILNRKNEITKLKRELKKEILNELKINLDKAEV